MPFPPSKSTQSSPTSSRSGTPTMKPPPSPPLTSYYGFHSNNDCDLYPFIPAPLDLSSSTGHLLIPESHPSPVSNSGQPSKYNQLLSVIQEMSKDVRPCYAGSKSSTERLKRAIIQAKQLVKEAIIESDKMSR